MSRRSRPNPAFNRTPRKRAAACFFVAFLVVQVVVPLVQLTQPRPARFGWQMYAGAKAPESVTLIRQDGSEKTYGMSFYLGSYRSDLDITEALPRFICQKQPHLKGVRLNFAGAPHGGLKVIVAVALLTKPQLFVTFTQKVEVALIAGVVKLALVAPLTGFDASPLAPRNHW